MGGGQESGIRAGTENVPYIHALALAVEESTAKVKQKQEHCKILKREFLKEMYDDKDFDSANILIASPVNSIESTLNICFKNIEGEVLMACLSDEEVFVGTGSACNSGSMEPSAVLQQMGIPDNYIRGAIRISMDLTNTVEEVRNCAKLLKKYYKGLTNHIAL